MQRKRCGKLYGIIGTQRMRAAEIGSTGEEQPIRRQYGIFLLGMAPKQRNQAFSLRQR